MNNKRKIKKKRKAVLNTQEAEIGGSQSEAGPGQKRVALPEK
jgi:hypothetical protein